MVKYLVFAFIFVLGFCGSASAPTYPYDHLKGTVRIINFWATWCKACQEELLEFSPALAGKKVNLILVNLDSDSSVGEKWLKENYKGEYLFVADPNYKIAEAMKLTSFPATFIVDKTDSIIYSQYGFEAIKSTDKLMKELAKISAP